MPIYEYVCKKCNKKFEELVRSPSSTAKIACPECGSKQTARALSTFAVADSAAKGSSEPPPMCGRCGGTPGSCQMD